MQGSKTWIIAVVALIIGAAGGYYGMQSRMSEVSGQVSTLEAQLADAKEMAKGTETKAADLAGQVSALQSEIDEKSKLVEDQAAKIGELEAALQQAAAPPAQ